MDVIEKLMVPLAHPRKVKLAPFGQISVAELLEKKMELSLEHRGPTIGLCPTEVKITDNFTIV